MTKQPKLRISWRDKLADDKGLVTTINEIRAALARRHGATIGCPITCGIFAWIAVNAASEAAAAGKKRITPYWRTLKTKAQRRLLEGEGHEVAKKGKRYVVQDFEVTDRSKAGALVEFWRLLYDGKHAHSVVAKQHSEIGAIPRWGFRAGVRPLGARQTAGTPPSR